MDLFIRHTTTYTYASPVQLGPHRLMLRPRDSFDLRILDTQLAIEPHAQIDWMHDVYGNPIAVATFEGLTQRLEIVSGLALRRYAPAFPRSRQSAPQVAYAPRYSDGERIVLNPFLMPATADDEGELARWIGETLAAREDIADPLMRLSGAIHAGFGYAVRYEEGTQDPTATLALGTGSCRDFAWLFIEAARRLGYAARFVSGYLSNAGDQDLKGTDAIGMTHAWAEVFAPGDGWVEYDPTNGLVADSSLIRVAVARLPEEASPISGSFIGLAGAQTGLAVGVDIRPTDSYSAVA